jgi:hypothetical protein
VADDAVVIRATRDTFSEQRKAAFIRELAAEGFIADSYQWFSPARPGSYFGAQWVIDYSWLELSPYLLQCARSFMERTLMGGLALWLVLLASLFLGVFQ